ncbi:sulfatase [Planctomycetota bacterium]|nr:sulfatase [Planctomycetota bacterium]
MTFPSSFPNGIARRSFLKGTGFGLGSMALSALLAKNQRASQDPGKQSQMRFCGVIKPRHITPRAKRVIWLYMAGGMTHLDTFDHKPKLAELNGKPMPESVTKGQQIAQLQGQPLHCFGPQHAFRQWGKSGQSIAEIWPHLGTMCADDLCIVRSLHTDAINHDPAHTFMNTGTMNAGRPAMGSWLQYGLGSECDNLPGFVVLVSTGNFGQKQPIAARQWHSGFLPGQYQGVEFRSTGAPVLYVGNPNGVSTAQQHDVVSAVRSLNELADQRLADPEIQTRVRQYELAFRMQTSVPDLMDVSGEPSHVLDLYGTKGGDGSFAANCLLARRLAERGVRFIQLYHRDWDHHGAVKEHSAGSAKEVDRGVAALITDLKQRGMLDDTIVVFGSEFGRTPMAQGDGRDHHLAGFTMWFAGGGFKPGFSYGATDELGYHAVENPCSVHDVHATLLHLLGIDHQRFTYKYQGLDSKLTGVEESVVVRELLA